LLEQGKSGVSVPKVESWAMMSAKAAFLISHNALAQAFGCRGDLSRIRSP
jgi:hypothetical protein